MGRFPRFCEKNWIILIFSLPETMRIHKNISFRLGSHRYVILGTLFNLSCSYIQRCKYLQNYPKYFIFIPTLSIWIHRVTFSCTFQSFIRYMIHSYYVIHSYMQSYIHARMHSFIFSFINSCIKSFFRKFVHLFLDIFDYSIFRPVIRFLAHSFICQSFGHSYTHS